MVHWPDNMVTYDAYDKILFSNDAFGQHFASSKHFDDEVGLPEVMAQAKKYYANIVMPYSRHVAKALGAIADAGFEFDMIAPSHGVIWRSHVAEDHGDVCEVGVACVRGLRHRRVRLDVAHHRGDGARDR